jgi:hypothetical protein
LAARNLGCFECEGNYRETWLSEVLSYDRCLYEIKQRWMMAKDAARELENAGTDIPRVFQGIDA